MITKVGRFDAYVPERDLSDTLLSIISKSLPKRGMKFVSSANKFHEFFFEMKRNYPSLFEGVCFKQSPDFKYSDELANCFIELQETGYLTRPNPSLTMYRIDTDFQLLNDDIDAATIDDIAKQFNKQFEIIEDDHNPSCR
jgi:hypothetical protein